MIFMGLILKIPIVAAFWLLWWAIRSEPDLAEAPEQDDGGQRRRYRRQPKRPGGPRRGGPHAPDSIPLPCPADDGVLVARRPLGRPLTARHGHGERR